MSELIPCEECVAYHVCRFPRMGKECYSVQNRMDTDVYITPVPGGFVPWWKSLLQTDIERWNKFTTARKAWNAALSPGDTPPTAKE